MNLSTLRIKYAIPYRKQIIRTTWIINYITIAFLITCFFYPPLQTNWILIGNFFGQVAVIFYTLTLLPSILNRFRIKQPDINAIQQLLNMFRRQIGIMTYFFVISHYFLVKLSLIIKYNIPPQNISFSPYEIAGFVAFLLLTPLFLTSNNRSTKWLGSHWKTLHRLTYLINWLIFLHLLLLDRGGWTFYLITAIALLELGSWLTFAYYKLKS